MSQRPNILGGTTYIPDHTCDIARIMDNLVIVPVAPLDTFNRFGTQKYCKDYIYIEILYNSGYITCFPMYICCPSKNIRSLGHVLGMLDGIWLKSGPKPQIT